MKSSFAAAAFIALSSTAAFASTADLQPVSSITAAQLSSCGFVVPAGAKIDPKTAIKIATFSALKTKTTCFAKNEMVKDDTRSPAVLTFQVEENTVLIKTGHIVR